VLTALGAHAASFAAARRCLRFPVGIIYQSSRPLTSTCHGQSVYQTKSA